MNQKGEMLTFYIFSMSLFLSLSILLGFSLIRTYKKHQMRAELFICAKKIKKLTHSHLSFMGKTSWGIQNLERFSKIGLLIPGLQMTSFKSKELKKALQVLQDFRDKKFNLEMAKLVSGSCLLKPQSLMSFFHLNGLTLARKNDLPILKEKRWNISVQNFYYHLVLNIEINDIISQSPNFLITSTEKMAR